MFDFGPLIPLIMLSLGGCGYLLSGQLLEETKTTGWFCCFILAATLGSFLYLPETALAAGNAVAIDPFSRLMAIVILVSALLSVLGGASAVHDEKIERLTEYYFLVLMSVAGAILMVMTGDFLTLFIGLEVASLSVYCLCAARVDKPASSESSLKYFLMGCFSSAFFLYGIALWYGATGSLALQAGGHLSVYSSPLLMISFLFLLVGFAFKIGLAPFHFWVPDVYQGAPTSVTTFMSCVIKIAGLGALMKVALVSFDLPNEWGSKVFWVLSVLAMTLGNLAALRQTSVKRMLAYSSVAQAGYMMIGFVALAQGPESMVGVVFYLVAYCMMSIGAFSVLNVMGPDADALSDFRGLGKKNLGLGICATLFFLGLAGLPPSLAGLVGKVFLFTSSLATDFVGLAIIAALNAALSCAYYLRVPMAIWFQTNSSHDSTSQENTLLVIAEPTRLAIAFCALAVVALGVFPEGLRAVAWEGVVFLQN
jgi:NADH-quinone oxidoreductase subunit N